jgi:hypothetical protein
LTRLFFLSLSSPAPIFLELSRNLRAQRFPYPIRQEVSRVFEVPPCRRTEITKTFLTFTTTVHDGVLYMSIFPHRYFVLRPLCSYMRPPVSLTPRSSTPRRMPLAHHPKITVHDALVWMILPISRPANTDFSGCSDVLLRFSIDQCSPSARFLCFTGSINHNGDLVAVSTADGWTVRCSWSPRLGWFGSTTAFGHL